MDGSLIILGVSLLALAGGASLGYYARQSIAKKQLSTAEGKAQKLIEDATKKEQELILEAKNKVVGILENAKKEQKEREDQILRIENRLEKREVLLDQKLSELDRGRSALEKKAEEIRKIRSEVEEARKTEMARLEKIAGLSREQAKTVLLQLTEEENREIIAEKIARIAKEGKEEIEKRAKNLMTTVIQKYAGSHAAGKGGTSRRWRNSREWRSSSMIRRRR